MKLYTLLPFKCVLYVMYLASDDVIKCCFYYGNHHFDYLLASFLCFQKGILYIYLLTLRICSRELLGTYAQDYPAQFILGYCSTYIFMQTFMIPGTIFMSLLAGALFGVFRGLLLVVFNATAGASSCFFLSKLIGRPLVNWLWPEKLRFFQAEV